MKIVDETKYSEQEVKRLAEAANSWIALYSIWYNFSPSDSVGRDLKSAEERLTNALKTFYED